MRRILLATAVLAVVGLVGEFATPARAAGTRASGPTAMIPALEPQGYVLVGADGGVFAFGTTPFEGSLTGKALAAPIVGVAETASGKGYWLAGRDKGIFAFGDAPFLGSQSGTSWPPPINGIGGGERPVFPADLNPAVGIAAEPPNGYGITMTDGAVYGYDADSSAAVTGTLTATIVGIAYSSATSTTWEAAADGGVFSPIGSTFYGSLGGQHLAAPVSGIAATPDGKGYWLVAQDGGVFTFGDAHFFGSLPALGVNPVAPIVGMAPTPDGNGYWLVGADGGVFTFGDARYLGGMAGHALAGPIVGIAAPSRMPPT